MACTETFLHFCLYHVGLFKLFLFITLVQFMHNVYMIRMKLQNLQCFMYNFKDNSAERAVWREFYGDCNKLAYRCCLQFNYSTQKVDQNAP